MFTKSKCASSKTNSIGSGRVPGRSKYDFSAKERQYIYRRDNGCCVVCGGRFRISIAHIFVSRAKGGFGVRENGVCLCIECHHALDNGLSADTQKKIQDYCEQYLRKNEKVKLHKIKDKGRWGNLGQQT